MKRHFAKGGRMHAFPILMSLMFLLSSLSDLTAPDLEPAAIEESPTDIAPVSAANFESFEANLERPLDHAEAPDAITPPRGDGNIREESLQALREIAASGTLSPSLSFRLRLRLLMLERGPVRIAGLKMAHRPPVQPPILRSSFEVRMPTITSSVRG
jgi:hypothetical protein